MGCGALIAHSRDGDRAPLVPWSMSIERAVAPAEMRRGSKAAGDRDIENGLRRLQQHRAGSVETKLQVIMARACAQVLRKQPFELPRRKLHVRRNLVDRPRL